MMEIKAVKYHLINAARSNEISKKFRFTLQNASSVRIICTKRVFFLIFRKQSQKNRTLLDI